MLRILKFVIVVIAAIAVGWVAYWAIGYKLKQLRAAEAPEMSQVTAEVRNRQLECLAKNIYYEAGYEPFEGKVAVAQVTLNRVESGKFPSDICRVIYQKNVVYDKVICQFSWYCEQSGGLKPKHPAAYKESMEVAKKVLLEGFRLPSLSNAIYFHAEHVSPGWNKEKVAKIGRHIFYSDNPGKK